MWRRTKRNENDQGYKYCKGVTKTWAIRLEDDFGRSLNYCPMCGRKLYEAVELAIKALEHMERCKKCKGTCESMAI